MSQGIAIKVSNAVSHSTRITRAANAYIIGASTGTSRGRTTLTAMANASTAFSESQQILTELAEVSQVLGHNILACNNAFVELDENLI